MAEIDRVQELEPYKSLVLAKIDSEATLSTLIEDCLQAVKREEILDIRDEEDVSDTEERVRIEKNCEANINSSAFSLEHGFLHYKLQKPVPWTGADDIHDIENHLVLFSRKKNVRLLALYASEKSRRRSIRRRFGSTEYDGLEHLHPIEPSRLNDAFFGDQVRTLWLSGMHRRVPVKADAKVLSGQDLEYALDPINDQTFYFSAVRSSSVQGASGSGEDAEGSAGGEDGDEDDDQDDEADELRTVGLSPKKSRIWTRPSKSWGQYLEGTDAILSELSKTLDSGGEDDGEPLPVLADVASGDDDIGAPYDMVIQPPELLDSDVEQDDEEQEDHEEWAYNAHFEVLEEAELGNDPDLIDDATPPNVVSDVYHRGEKIGRVAIELDASDRTDVKIEAVEVEGDNEDDEEQEGILKTLKRLCKSKRKLKVYYDSGHTLSGGALYSVQFQNRPFDQFVWASFNEKKYDITKEKPSDFPTEGDDVKWDPEKDDEETEEEQRYSLFHWVYENWPPDPGVWNSSDFRNDWDGADGPQGWLAIDDGSMEIADFIHFREPEDDNEKPVLSLIHVKASGSDSDNREISVANYEVVTGQAVKNLRHLETTDLADELRIDGEKNKVDSYVWKDGSLATVSDEDDVDTRRGKMAKALDQGTDVERRVVVLQPHILKPYYEKVRDSEGGQNEQRLQQLNALLNGARQSCSGLGAEFWVVAAKGEQQEVT